MDTETVMTPAEVANLKGVKTATVYLAIKTRQLRAQQVFGRVVIEKSSAAEWTPVKSSKERGKMGGRPKNSPTATEPPAPAPAQTPQDGTE